LQARGGPCSPPPLPQTQPHSSHNAPDRIGDASDFPKGDLTHLRWAAAKARRCAGVRSSFDDAIVSFSWHASRSSPDHSSSARECTASRLPLPPVQSRVYGLRTSRTVGDCAVPSFTMRGKDHTCRRLLSCHRLVRCLTSPGLLPTERRQELFSPLEVLARAQPAEDGMGCRQPLAC